MSGVRLGRAMLEQLDMNTMDMEPSEPLLPIAVVGSKQSDSYKVWVKSARAFSFAHSLASTWALLES